LINQREFLWSVAENRRRLQKGFSIELYTGDFSQLWQIYPDFHSKTKVLIS